MRWFADLTKKFKVVVGCLQAAQHKSSFSPLPRAKLALKFCKKPAKHSNWKTVIRFWKHLGEMYSDEMENEKNMLRLIVLLKVQSGVWKNAMCKLAKAADGYKKDSEILLGRETTNCFLTILSKKIYVVTLDQLRLRAQRLWFAISTKPSIYLMGILVYCCPSCQVQMFPQTWIVTRFPHDWTGRHGIGSCQHYSLELQRSIGFLWELQQICTQLNPTMLPTLTDWLIAPKCSIQFLVARFEDRLQYFQDSNFISQMFTKHHHPLWEHLSQRLEPLTRTRTIEVLTTWA